MRYVIYGAGAVGGTIGGRLAQHGADVVLVARGDHGRAIRSGGLRLHSPDDSVVLPIPCVEHPGEIDLRPDDVVVLSMKTQDTAPALDALRAVAPPELAVVCAQNGVENERLAARRFANVYAMCVMLPATHLEPGSVDVSSSPVSGILDLGRYPSGADDVAAAIAADLERSSFSSRPDPRIMRLKYSKLLSNLGNALDAACGPGARGGDLHARARKEALECYAAAGIDAATAEEDRARRGNLMSIRPIEGRPRGGSSSWQSLARGTGSIESDYLNGEVVLLGRLHDVPTPVNALLQSTAARLAREGGQPGSVPLDDLVAQLA